MRMKIDEETIKDLYPLFGPVGMSNIYPFTRRYFVKRANNLNIRYRRTRFINCEGCGKDIYPHGNKSNLCRSCSAKKIARRRGNYLGHATGRQWSQNEIDYLIKNYYSVPINEIKIYLKRDCPSIIHKANRLNLKRDKKFRSVTAWTSDNNPALNPILKEKMVYSLRKYYKDNPNKLLNARLKRNQMTKIEKIMDSILKDLKVKYKWNQYLKTKDGWKFPDFLIGNLIIECDGTYWHKKNKEQDNKRQKLLEDEGYKVIRFSEERIKNNMSEVKQCVQQELSQLRN